MDSGHLSSIYLPYASMYGILYLHMMVHKSMLTHPLRCRMILTNRIYAIEKMGDIVNTVLLPATTQQHLEVEVMR